MSAASHDFDIEKIHAEISKLIAETSKINAEISKTDAETRKLNTESRWHPLVAGAGGAAALIAATWAVVYAVLRFGH